MAVKQDIIIHQGSTFVFLGHVQHKIPDGCVGAACSIVDMNLTGLLVRAQIRKTHDACVAYGFTCTVTDAIGGKFELMLPADISQTLPAVPHVWDVEIYDPSDVTQVIKPFYGNVTVIPEVTK